MTTTGLITRRSELITQLENINDIIRASDDTDSILLILANIEGQIKMIDQLISDPMLTGKNEIKKITFTISGTSDDLIEIEGDIYDEIGAYTDYPDTTKFVMSDGTKGDIVYSDEGVWRVKITPANGTTVNIVSGISEDIDPNSDYTDKATITGRIEWIIFEGGTLIRAK